MAPRERIVVVGSGGREHALAWRLARDPETAALWALPGNDAMAREWPCLATREDDVAGVVAAARSVDATLVVIGPETPLALGLADALHAAGIAAYGPSAAAARLETSKWFAKSVMTEARVPTARAVAFTEVEAALASLDQFAPPWVIKADGLAAGKGVSVSADRVASERFVREALSGGRFGDAGRRVVLEEHLDGEEVSVMAICDGERHVPLTSARDHKRAQDGDRGPNTGGMGALAPAPRVDTTLETQVSERILAPVLAALSARGTPFVGTLYAGLMLTAQGPLVLEFNARFGDPETEVVLPLTGGSLTRALASAARGALDATALARGAGAAVGVALVDAGYPDRVVGGGRIVGLDSLASRPGVHVFHAATTRDDGGWRVRGGRAAHVVARAADRDAARREVYAAIDTLAGEGWRCRRDIGLTTRVEAHT